MNIYIGKNNPLIRNGTSQAGRILQALLPSSVKIDGQSVADTLEFAKKYAQLINYYNQNNEKDGDWQNFFEIDTATILSETFLKSGKVESHLGLFITFLELFKYAREEINILSQKHLDFYYKKVLRLKEKPAAPDKVHVLFELARNLNNHLISKGTCLKAGKDSDGKKLFYCIEEDIIVNKAKVKELRSVLVDKSNNSTVHQALVSNSADGLGEALDKENPKWPAFGKKEFSKAKIGFALASPILWLQEGERKINVCINIKDEKINNIPKQTLQNAFEIYLSGTEAWIGPKYVTPAISYKSNEIYELKFDLTLNSGEDAVDFYNIEVLEDSFDRIYPVMKVLLNTNSENYINKYLQNVKLSDVKISVDVSGIHNLHLENDLGILDPSKPFLPFGPEPKKGSGFYIGCNEAFIKKLDEFSLKIEWQDVPSPDLWKYYSSSYNNVKLDYSLGSSAFKANVIYKKKDGTINTKIKNLFNTSNNTSPTTITISDTKHYYSVFPLKKIKQAVYYQGKKMSIETMQSKVRFLPVKKAYTGNNIKKLTALLLTDIKEKSLKEGFIMLELLHDFLHTAYIYKYTKAVAEFSKTPGSLILNLPKEPYTPLMKSLSLEYKSSTSNVNLSLSSENDFLNKEIEFFHVGAFGEREVHGYLNQQLDFLIKNEILLLPDYSNEGELYVGIMDIEPLQNLSLLFQVADGSAEPENPKQQICWSILVGNQWMELNDNNLLSDTTNGLLESGIVKIYVPKGATGENSYLPYGQVWIRASVKADTGAICQLVDIKPQAAKAVFIDKGNSPDHLKTPLKAGSITKLKDPKSSIKTVEQPYASFDGLMKENKLAYYTRVSEKLRHKNRAINIWDYERLVLQEFPKVYKIKCLNHTSDKYELAPGHVTIIAIPDLTNINAVNKLEPKVSKGTLENIETYLKGLNSGFVEMHVINPVYEQIMLDFKVKFKKDYEFGYYKDQLNTDIIDFLSPWVSGKSKEISFGGWIHKSVILYFIEQLKYVDFVTNFKMYHFKNKDDEEVDTDQATASNSKAILVSIDKHRINNYQEY